MLKLLKKIDNKERNHRRKRLKFLFLKMNPQRKAGYKKINGQQWKVNSVLDRFCDVIVVVAAALWAAEEAGKLWRGW